MERAEIIKRNIAIANVVQPDWYDNEIAHEDLEYHQSFDDLAKAIKKMNEELDNHSGGDKRVKLHNEQYRAVNSWSDLDLEKAFIHVSEFFLKLKSEPLDQQLINLANEQAEQGACMGSGYDPDCPMTTLAEALSWFVYESLPNDSDIESDKVYDLINSKLK